MAVFAMMSMRRRGYLPSCMLASLGLLTGCPSYVEVASGSDVAIARAALADDGTVVVTRSSDLLVTDGDAESAVNLPSAGLEVANVYAPGFGAQVRAAGDVVFVAEREPTVGDSCDSTLRGVYATTVTGGAISLLHETCNEASGGWGIAMSTNGTIAFSTIVSSSGAIYRGPVDATLTVLQSGSGEFYNNRQISVNDNGRVMLEMEYVDGFAGGLMRALLAFDEPGQTKLELDTAIEKLSVGVQLPHAINNGGQVVFTLNYDAILTIDGEDYAVPAGVHTASPTPFNSPKALTTVATKADGYCRFGRVDVNDEGTVVFEAVVNDGGGGDACPTSNTGLYFGPNPENDAFVSRGSASLKAHQYFDDIILGELNNAGQLVFTTTYSEPLVDPVKVWRRDP